MALIFCQSCISILSEYYEYKDEIVMRRPTVWRVAVANDSVWRRSLDSEQLGRTENTTGTRRLLACATAWLCRRITMVTAAVAAADACN